MFSIGCHLSIAKGYKHMGEEALSIGANTFQFFTRNPRGAKAKDIDPTDVQALRDFLQTHNFAPVLGHAPYTLNACSNKPEIRNLAVSMISDDLQRMELLPENLYNLHPGSHVGQGTEQGIDYIASMLNSVLDTAQSTRVLLETMAGKGSEIGGTFEELRAILDKVNLREHMGICLDTCHIFDAGYDIVNNLDGVLEEFDSILGLDALHAIHLNDSLNPLASRKDRHAKIGQGNIGLAAISRLIRHPQLRHLPFYLETPNELDGYAAEIALLHTEYSK